MSSIIIIKDAFRLSILCAIYVLLVVNQSFAQDLTYLEQEASRAEKWQDKVDIYLQIADSTMWIGTDIDKSKEYAEKVLKLCKDKDCGDKILSAYVYLAEFGLNRGDYAYLENNILQELKKNNFKSKTLKAHFEEIAGSYYLVNGNTEKSIHHLTQGRKLLEKEQPTSKRLCNIYLYMAYSYNINGRNDSSIFFMNKSVEQSRLINDNLLLIDGLSGLSTLYSTDGNNAKAIKYLLDGIEIMNNHPITENRKYLLYGSLIDLYIRNKDYETAEKDLLKLIPELRNEKISINAKANDLWSFNMSMAKLLGKVNRAKEGLVYVDSAYVYAEYLNSFSVRITDLRQASLNLKANNYELAASQFESLLKKVKISGEIDAFNAVLVGQFADLYTKSNIKPTREIYQDFIPVIDRIIEKNKNQYNLDVLDAQRLSAILGIYNQEPTRTLNSLRAIIAIKDTLQNQEKLKVSNELLIQYQTTEKEKELKISALALSKNQTQRNALIGAALGLLLLIGVLSLYYNQKRKYTTTLEEDVEKRTADLKSANKALLQSNEELERYTYIASHDLKEPLRDILNFITLIKRKETIKEKETLLYFDFVEKGAIQINKIVQDVVSFSDIRNINLTIETINIPKIIEDINHTFTKQFSEKQIVFRTAHLPNQIKSNQILLNLILKNIIENGIKYNNNPIVNISISYAKINDKHQFKIQDDGIGIDKEYFDIVFKMFKRLHNRSKYSGSGIGLAICKRSVEHLNGEITLKSELKKGSTFIVEFPIVD